MMREGFPIFIIPLFINNLQSVLELLVLQQAAFYNNNYVKIEVDQCAQQKILLILEN